MEKQIKFLVENYYDIQKLRVETFNRIVAYVKSHDILENHNANASRIKDGTHEKLASQNNIGDHLDNASHADKPSILAHKIVSLKVEPPKEISDLVWFHNTLHETEKQLRKRLDAWSKHHKLRLNYLRYIKGIGPILSSALIAWLQPISRFPNISKLWAYCGLSPTQKREKGKRLNYNPKLKTLMWKIATSFEKQNPEKSQYRRLYDKQKDYYMNREDLKAKIKAKEKGIKGHIRNMTLRYVVKRFLADLWITWRKLEGLPITLPYIIGKGAHSNFEMPKTDENELLE